MIIITIFIVLVIMFSFVVIEVIPVAATETVNITDKMKFLCIKIDTSNAIDQIKDKEQQEQCKKFLDNVSIYELKQLIDKYQEVEKSVD